MVKGIARRVVVIEPPDQKLFEQAIFIVRDGAAGEGVSARALVEEARKVAREYAAPRQGGLSGFRRRCGALAWVLLGACLTALAWAAYAAAG